MQQHVDGDRVRRGLDDRVRVLAQLGRRLMREMRPRPRLRIDAHIQQHVARTRAQVLQRNDRELGHDRKREHAARVLPYAQVHHARLVLEEIRARVQPRRAERVRACRALRVKRNAVDEIMRGFVLEVLARVRELAPGRLAEQQLRLARERVLRVVRLVVTDASPADRILDALGALVENVSIARRV